MKYILKAVIIIHKVRILYKYMPKYITIFAWVIYTNIGAYTLYIPLYTIFDST